MSDAFMGEAVPIENDSTVMVQTSFSNGHFCKWNEGRPSGDHGHCHLTTSYSEGQGYFLSCCFCVVTMFYQIKIATEEPIKQKADAVINLFLPLRRDWDDKHDAVVHFSKSAWKALRGCAAMGRVGTVMG